MSQEKNVQLFQNQKADGIELSENIGQLKIKAADGIFNSIFNSSEFEGIKKREGLYGGTYAY